MVIKFGLEGQQRIEKSRERVMLEGSNAISVGDTMWMIELYSLSVTNVWGQERSLLVIIKANGGATTQSTITTYILAG